MTAANIDHTNLDAQAFGGIVREDVMNKIWDVSRIPLPFTEMCSKGTHKNQRVEFTTDDLGTPATDNAVIDGADVDQDDSVLTLRVSNFTQTSLKEIQISTRAEQSDSIGRAGSMSYQIMQAQRRLRRDVEAQMLTHQASVAGDGTAAPGISAGLGAQLATNVIGGVGFVAGGFDTVAGVFDAPTPGTAEALTETRLRDVLELIHVAGGDTKVMMCTPAVCRLINAYLFTDAARIATLTSDNNQKGDTRLTAFGGVNTYISDFGSPISIVSNRLQPQDDTDTSTLYLLDAAHLEQSFMRGYVVEPLAKTGLSEKRMCSVDYSLLVLNELSCGAIMAIDETAPMTA